MTSSTLNLFAFTAAHMAGLKDHVLAQHFAVSVSTIKRWRKRLALPGNDFRNNQGKLGERLVAEEFTRQGFSVRHLPVGHPFDLLVGGRRVEVKTSATPHGSQYRFRLNEHRSSNHARYRYGKTYQRDSDFIVLAILEGTALKRLYVLPTALWKPSIVIRPDSPFCPYAAYQDAVEALREAKVA